MTTQQPEALTADHSEQNLEMVARWYMLNKMGMATLCASKADAEKEAADAQRFWPHMGPHRAVQLVEASFDAADMATASADGYRASAAELRRQHARIAELEAQLEAIGAGGVSGPLMGRTDDKERAGRFTKKPVTIDAWLIDFGNKPLPDWVNEAFRTEAIDWCPAGEGLYIDTLEGHMLGANGSWLIKGVKGELYACKPDIFAATYERASLAASAGSEPVVRVNDDGFIVEIGDLLIAPGQKLYLRPSPQGGMVGEQALRKVLSVVQRYLPPDGPSAHDATSEITAIVDPWPLGPMEKS